MHLWTLKYVFQPSTPLEKYTHIVDICGNCSEFIQIYLPNIQTYIVVQVLSQQAVLPRFHAVDSVLEGISKYNLAFKCNSSCYTTKTVFCMEFEHNSHDQCGACLPQTVLMPLCIVRDDSRLFSHLCNIYIILFGPSELQRLQKDSAPCEYFMNSSVNIYHVTVMQLCIGSYRRGASLW